MIDLLLLVVAIGATPKRVNTGNTVGRVASVRSRLYLNGSETLAYPIALLTAFG